MSEVIASLMLPDLVAEGLAEGELERVGGVIRDIDSEQVVAWLRTGKEALSAAEGGVLAGLFNATGVTAGTAATILGHALPVLDVALAGYTLMEIARHIRRQQERIEAIHQQIATEFSRDRQINLITALQSAENMLQAEGTEYKSHTAGYIADRLIAAQAQLLWDIDALLEFEMTPQQAEQALNYHILAMQVVAMTVRCWLEIDELELACGWLRNTLREHHRRVERFVRNRVGEHPALYFHESVSDVYFERYLNIERWLRGQRDVLPAIVKEHRRHFWKSEVVSTLYTGGLTSSIKYDPFYIDALPQAEILIENYQRLAGFLLEIESMPHPFAEWDAYAPFDAPDDPPPDDCWMLVDAAFLTKAT